MQDGAAARESNLPKSPEEQLTFYPTDPDEVIEIGEDRHVADANPTPLSLSYRQLFEKLSVPDTSRNTKDGPGYLQGACHGRRNRANIPVYRLAVFDADSTRLKSGDSAEGAPPPDLVHAALIKYGISHHIYTTFSNGEKGHRYRILFPCTLTSPAQLRGLMLYLTDILQVTAEIPIFLTPESVRWGMRWHYPRLPSTDAEFFHATYFGNTVDAAFPALHYGQLDAKGQELNYELPEPRNLNQTTSDTPIGQFCKMFSIPAMLEGNGYDYCGQGVICIGGLDTPTLRFKPHESKSQPGIIVLQVEDRWRAYSHHATDALCNDYLNDAYDVAQIVGMLPEGIDSALKMIEEEKTAFMEHHFPVVLEAGKQFRIASLTESDLGGLLYNFLRFDDFKNFISNDGGVFKKAATEDLKGMKRLHSADWWKEHQTRSTYNNTKFLLCPFGQKPERAIKSKVGTTFNTFQGWNFEPTEKADYNLIDWHVKYVLCDGNETDYNYLLDWIAHLLQFPNEKPGVAIVMRGEKGTGKSLFWSSLVKKLGSLGLVISNSKLLTGDFNAHLQSRLLGLVEESFWAGNPSEEGRLKTLITDHEGTTEKKGVDAYESRSFIRLALITNNDWAVPASDDERRYFVPTLSRIGIDYEEKTGRYFSALAMQLDGAGLESFLTMLSKRPISTAKVRRAPPGAGLQRQKALSLTGVRAWLFDSLTKGVIIGEGRRVQLERYPKETLLDLELLEEATKPYTGRHANARSQVFGSVSLLQSYFGDLPLVDAGQARCMTLPPLETMRDQFARKIGSPDYNWSLMR